MNLRLVSMMRRFGMGGGKKIETVWVELPDKERKWELVNITLVSEGMYSNLQYLFIEWAETHVQSLRKLRSVGRTKD